MLYHIFSPLVEYIDTLRLFNYITFRAAFAAITAFFISIVLGRWLIRYFHSKRISEKVEKSPSEVLRELHRGKAETPTMGGLFISAGILASTLLWARLDNLLVWLAVATVSVLTLLGFYDDLIKLRSVKKRGISVKFKLAVQILLAIAVAIPLQAYLSANASYEPEPTKKREIPIANPPTTNAQEQKADDELQTERSQPERCGTRLFFPFFKNLQIELGILFLLLVVIVLVGTSNAVNLTDGLDGLAGGCVLMVGFSFTTLAYVIGRIDFARYLFVPYVPGAGELSVFLASLIGATLGFLWYNCYPAQIFMGDTGSLPLGGAIGYTAVATKSEMLLFIVGGIFVAEALSVLLQIISFRFWGKRIFKCAPLHHHFQFLNWKETKITTRFWIVAAILAFFGVASLKLR